MSSLILKYELNFFLSTDVPTGKVVLAGMQNEKYFVWVDIDSFETRQIHILATGETAKNGWTHVYSFQDFGFVWHVFSE